jgi:flagellar biosynthesis protein FlhB
LGGNWSRSKEEAAAVVVVVVFVVVVVVVVVLGVLYLWSQLLQQTAKVSFKLPPIISLFFFFFFFFFLFVLCVLGSCFWELINEVSRGGGGESWQLGMDKLHYSKVDGHMGFSTNHPHS